MRFIETPKRGIVPDSCVCWRYSLVRAVRRPRVSGIVRVQDRFFLNCINYYYTCTVGFILVTGTCKW